MAFWLAISVLPGAAFGFTWPWEIGGPWPSSSDQPVITLDHPTLEDGRAGLAPGRGTRFVAFGDQRALADGEWQALMLAIASRDAQSPIHFMIDTGDIVDDGRHSDQFHSLRSILSPARKIPYLVGVGNHEVHNNRDRQARDNTALFLSYLDPAFDADRMYYDKRVGPVRFVFLDTNDLVYGDANETDGVPPPQPPSGSRAEAQMLWLTERLAEFEPAETIVLMMHHPLLHSSQKHQTSSIGMWSYRFNGRQLPHLFLDAGVDLILTGHTHTYERFRIEREDGRYLHQVNVSGRPRTTFLWFGAGSRRPRDIRGREVAWLTEEGWDDLDGWKIEQLDVMTDDERNQFALFEMDDMGSLSLQMCFVDDDGREEMMERVYFE